MNDTSNELSQSLMYVGGLLGAVALVVVFVFGVAKDGYGKNMEGIQVADAGDYLERIRPVVTLDDIRKGAEEAAAAAAAPAATAEAGTETPAAAAASGGDDLAAGEAAYKTACFACHDTGAANAPKLSDKAAWADRLGGGIDGLTASAIKGKGAMPPKGGAMQLSDQEIRNIVAYILNNVQ